MKWPNCYALSWDGCGYPNNPILAFTASAARYQFYKRYLDADGYAGFYRFLLRSRVHKLKNPHPYVYGKRVRAGNIEGFRQFPPGYIYDHFTASRIYVLGDDGKNTIWHPSDVKEISV